jgi:hypothetical protein
MYVRTSQDWRYFCSSDADPKYCLEILPIHYSLGCCNVVIFSDGPDEKEALVANRRLNNLTIVII